MGKLGPRPKPKSCGSCEGSSLRAGASVTAGDIPTGRVSAEGIGAGGERATTSDKGAAGDTMLSRATRIAAMGSRDMPNCADPTGPETAVPPKGPPRRTNRRRNSSHPARLSVDRRRHGKGRRHRDHNEKDGWPSAEHGSSPFYLAAPTIPKLSAPHGHPTQNKSDCKDRCLAGP